MISNRYSNCLPECQNSVTKYLGNLSAKEDNYQDVIFGDIVYQNNIILEEIGIISRQVCKQWALIQNTLFQGWNVTLEELSSARKQVCDLLELVIMNVYRVEKETSMHNEHIENILLEMKRCHVFALPICEAEPAIVAKIVRSPMNNTKCPMYIYIHTYLDMEYCLLTLDFLCQKPINLVEIHLRKIMKDLICIARTSYNQENDKATVFLCSCFHNFWLSLQVFTETKYNSQEIFWKQFNIVLENEDPLLTMWLLRNIAYLHTFNICGEHLGSNSERIYPNFILLESKLKQLISSSDNDSLTKVMRNMRPLVNELWLRPSKIEIYQLLWDYLSKRLGSQDTNVASYIGSVNSFSEFIDTILWCPNDCESDFYIFIAALVIHLREHPHHWARIKGRIYSHLSPHKLKDFNITGIFNVLVLYVCLSTIHLEDLTKKILSIIEVLPSEKAHTEVVWNVYIYFMMRHVKDGRNIQHLSLLMVRLLQEDAQDPKNFWLIKIFINGYEKIIENSKNMQLQQNSLIDSWLSKYLSRCYYNDLVSTLNVLIMIADRAKSDDAWLEWEPTFEKYVYPMLKQLGNSSNAPGIIGKLGAKLSLLSPAICADLFNYFNSENMSAKVSSEYLCELLADYPNNCMLLPHQENMALQSWIKTCILTVETNEQLTTNIVKLGNFPHAVKNRVTTSKDAFVTFIEYLGSNVKEHLKSHNMIKLCENCFGQTDRWVTQYFIQPDNEGVVTRIYTSIALTFLHCGPLLYDRNKTTCPLIRLITALLLPTEFMIGKSLHPHVLNGVKKTWRIYVQAIIKLNYTSDSYLDRTLRDLVVKYLPYFASSDSPILKSFDNKETASVVLDKISSAFFKHPTKESDANVSKALKLINDYVLSTTATAILKLIIKKTLHNIFEVIIFHNQRNTAVSVVKNITSSPLHGQVKDDVQEAIITITEKYMAFNTINYFQLMTMLAKFIPSDVSAIVPRLKEHLVNVERMRGVGNDKVLRMHFEKLQNVLQNDF